MRSLIPTIHKYLSSIGSIERIDPKPFGFGLSTDEPAHKEYARFPRLPLPAQPLPKAGLDELLSKRASSTDWLGESLSLNTLGALLGTLRIRPDGKRPFPSGGGLYPIETYLVMSGNLYHYHPTQHCLEVLWPVSEQDSNCLLRHDESGLPPCLILFTAVWQRSIRKYGERSYRLAVLEAGHMAQNILLAATALDCAAAPHGTQVPELIGEMLNVSEEDEQLVYTIRLGHKKGSLSTQS